MERLIKYWIYLSFSIVMLSIIFLFGFIFFKGSGTVSWEFLFDSPEGTVVGSAGGILPAIMGSFYYTFVSCAFAAILALATAFYQVFFCSGSRKDQVLQLVMESIAGIPSIVLGLFGYTCLVLHLGLGKSILAGGITVGIMILPFMEVQIVKCLREINIELLHASQALGIGKFYMIKNLILPQLKEEIVFITLLSACHAIGAAAPLMFTGAVLLAPVPHSLREPAMSLPNHLYNLLSQGISIDNAYGTAFVLLIIVLFTNLLPVIYFFYKSREVFSCEK